MKQNPLRLYFFLGPSMDRAGFLAECAALHPAEVRVLPPVQQGSLLSLLDDPPDVIGIIDGYFLQVPSVLHKEIMLMLQRGVRVLGASSMGALRAAELDTLGMEGVGSVYQMYKHGIIDGDDEVAVLHAPEHLGFRSLSEPLVNIRYNLRRAQARRIVPSRVAAVVLKCAKQLPYTLRSFDATLKGAREAIGDHPSLDSLQEFLSHDTRDLKREDVSLLVQTIVARVNKRQSWPSIRPIVVNESKYLYRQKRHYVGRHWEGRSIPDAVVISIHRVVSRSFPHFYHRIARHSLILDEARHRKLLCDETSSAVDDFFRLRGLDSDSSRRQWLREHHLEPDELLQTLSERQLLLKIRRLYQSLHPGLLNRAATDNKIVADVVARTGVNEVALSQPFFVRPGIPGEERLIREMKVTGRFQPAFRHAIKILNSNTEIRAAKTNIALSDRQVERWVAARWGINESALALAMRFRGFISYGEFVEASRFVYIHEISRLLFVGAEPSRLGTTHDSFF